MSQTIFDISRAERRAHAQRVDGVELSEATNDLPAELLRQTPIGLPEVSELQSLRQSDRSGCIALPFQAKPPVSW